MHQNNEWGDNVILLKGYFTIYIDILILAIGLYMAFVQGPNLTDEKMEREGRFSQIIGYIYLVIGIIGVFITVIY